MHKPLAIFLLSVTLAVAAKTLPGKFIKERNAIITIAEARVRLEPYYYRNALKNAEERISVLYRKAKIKLPSPELDKDINTLTAVLDKAKSSASPNIPEKKKESLKNALDYFWNRYKNEFELILKYIKENKSDRLKLKATYWDATDRFDKLKKKTMGYMEGFSISDDKNLNSLVTEDYFSLLKAIDPVETEDSLKLVLPNEYPLPQDTDFALFFKPLGQLPNKHPDKSGSFTLKPNTRTPVRCERRLCTIYRITKGRSIISVDGKEKIFKFGYHVIPEKSMYYIKNVEGKEAVLNYIAVKRY